MLPFQEQLLEREAEWAASQEKAQAQERRRMLEQHKWVPSSTLSPAISALCGCVRGLSPTAAALLAEASG